jgi:hypothetical protein
MLRYIVCVFLSHHARQRARAKRGPMTSSGGHPVVTEPLAFPGSPPARGRQRAAMRPRPYSLRRRVRLSSLFLSRQRGNGAPGGARGLRDSFGRPLRSGHQVPDRKQGYKACFPGRAPHAAGLRGLPPGRCASGAPPQTSLRRLAKPECSGARCRRAAPPMPGLPGIGPSKLSAIKRHAR